VSMFMSVAVRVFVGMLMPMFLVTVGFLVVVRMLMGAVAVFVVVVMMVVRFMRVAAAVGVKVDLHIRAAYSATLNGLGGQSIAIDG